MFTFFQKEIGTQFFGSFCKNKFSIDHFPLKSCFFPKRKELFSRVQSNDFKPKKFENLILRNDLKETFPSWMVSFGNHVVK